MRSGLWNYLRAAFNARPIGMFIPPNWIGVGAFALLGLVNPGFWVMGAGVELGYLYLLVGNRRFRHLVDSTQVAAQRQQWQDKIQSLVSQLELADRTRYDKLSHRCQLILQRQGQSEQGAPELQTQSEGLGRLLWMYLRLLLTRQSIVRVLNEVGTGAAEREPLESRVSRLQEQLKDPAVAEDLRKSLSGQLEILQQRVQGQQEAHQKLTFVEAELTRIEEQVELIREQAALATDPGTVSQRIDQIAATLGGTTQWIREQQQIYGSVEDLLAEPPAIGVACALPGAKESQ